MPRNVVLILLGMLTFGFSFGACGPVITALVGKTENPLTNAFYNGFPFVMYFVAAPLAVKLIKYSGVRASLLVGSGLITTALLLFAYSAFYQSSVGLAWTNLVVITGAVFFKVGGDTAINQDTKEIREQAQPLFSLLSQLGIFLGSALLALFELSPELKAIQLSYPSIIFLVSAAVFVVSSPMLILLLWQKNPKWRKM